MSGQAIEMANLDEAVASCGHLAEKNKQLHEQVEMLKEKLSEALKANDFLKKHSDAVQSRFADGEWLIHEYARRHTLLENSEILNAAVARRNVIREMHKQNMQEKERKGT